MFNFFSYEINLNPQALEDMKEKRRKSQAHMLFFLAAPYIFPDQGWNPYSTPALGTQSHNHWTVRQSHMFLFLLLGLEKGSPGFSGTIQVDVGQAGLMEYAGRYLKAEEAS